MDVQSVSYRIIFRRKRPLWKKILCCTILYDYDHNEVITVEGDEDYIRNEKASKYANFLRPNYPKSELIIHVLHRDRIIK